MHSPCLRGIVSWHNGTPLFYTLEAVQYYTHVIRTRWIFSAHILARRKPRRITSFRGRRRIARRRISNVGTKKQCKRKPRMNKRKLLLSRGADGRFQKLFEFELNSKLSRTPYEEHYYSPTREPVTTPGLRFRTGLNHKTQFSFLKLSIVVYWYLDAYEFFSLFAFIWCLNEFLGKIKCVEIYLYHKP